MEGKNNAQEYWAWLDNGKLHHLGLCESFDEASEKTESIGRACHWIFSRKGLEEMQEEISKKLAESKEDANEALNDR